MSSCFEFDEDELIELALLRSLEVDEVVENGLINASCRFNDELLNRICYDQPEITISVSTGSMYPAQQLEIEYENKYLSRLVMDALRIECRKVVSEGELKNNLESWRNRDQDNVFDYHMTALGVLNIAREFLRKYRDRLRESNYANSNLDGVLSGNFWELGSNTLKNVYIHEKGVDVSTLSIDATASSVLGHGPEGICAFIPSQFRILHVESVLRADLFATFQWRQQTMLKDLMQETQSALRKCIPRGKMEGHGRDTIESMARLLTTPKMTFHGTSNRFIPSIVRHGFLAPGAKHPETHQPLPIRCGSTYGQGIYSSPSAEFSLSYSGSEARPTTKDGFWGLKLVVCATLMGRSAQMTRSDEWWTQSQPYAGADSHVGNSNMEYIVFSNDQIIPCYVIHLDWGKDNEMYFENVLDDKQMFVERLSKPHPKLYVEELMPGDRQRAKQALMAKASKYFPYGYGPATGTRFVVEDVGEVDEDEEEYGDYQQMRIDATHEKANFWEWEEEESGDKIVQASKLDEYTQFRSGSGKTGI